MSYVQLSGAGFQVAYPVSLWAPGPLSGVVKVLSGDGLHCNYVFVYSYMGRRSPAHSARQLGAAQRTARGSRGRCFSRLGCNELVPAGKLNAATSHTF